MISLVANGPGLGDAVVLTCVARELAIQRGESCSVSAAFGEVFDRLPNVASVTPWTGRVSFPELHDMAGRWRRRARQHQVAVMCESLGLDVPPWANICPVVAAHESTGHISGYPADGTYVTVSTTPGAWTRNKDWVDGRWQSLVSGLRDLFGVRVVQVGGSTDVRLGACDAWAMGEPIVHVARILAGARVHVAPVTGTMHLATAVGTPVVALFLGRESPLVTGYARNVNLTASVDCSPCWLVEPCPYAPEAEPTPCASEVSVDRVLHAVKELL